MVAYDFKDLPGDENWVNPCLIHGESLGIKDRLYAGEELFNDWHGDTLILGQEGRGVSLDDRELRYGKELSWAFNKLILEKFSGFRAVLGNVIWFYKISNTQGSLKLMSDEVKQANQMILKNTIQEMKNLRQVFCLGKGSYQIFCDQMDLKGNPTFFSSVVMDGVQIYCIPHPGNRGMNWFKKEANLNHEEAKKKWGDFVRNFIS